MSNIKLVQSAHVDQVGSSTPTATFGSPTAIGTLLVLWCFVNGQGRTTTLSVPGAWSTIVNIADGLGDDTFALAYYANNPGGITSVTCTQGTTDPVTLIITEFSGLTSNPLDQSGSLTFASPAPPCSITTPSATVQAEELVVAGFGSSDGVNQALYPGAESILIAQDGAQVLMEYYVTGTQGKLTANASWQGGTVHNYQAVIATFKATSPPAVVTVGAAG